MRTILLGAIIMVLAVPSVSRKENKTELGVIPSHRVGAELGQADRMGAAIVAATFHRQH